MGLATWKRNACQKVNISDSAALNEAKQFRLKKTQYLIAVGELPSITMITTITVITISNVNINVCSESVGIRKIHRSLDVLL